MSFRSKHLTVLSEKETFCLKGCENNCDTSKKTVSY